MNSKFPDQTPRYNTIGVGYDSTRKADPYLTSRMFELLELDTNALYVDVGCGTGNYTSALNRLGMKFIGIDPSDEMLNKAGLKNSDISWIKGNSESIPLDINSADGVLVSLSIHHWNNLKAGFREIHRILKPNGRFVLFTTLPEQTRAYWLSHYFPQMIIDSISILPTRSALENALDSAGLGVEHEETYSVHEELEDWFLYCGKHHPERYFREDVRAGISSFSMLAYRDEVSSGLAKLKDDLESCNFKHIYEKSINTNGDYLFIKSRKL